MKQVKKGICFTVELPLPLDPALNPNGRGSKGHWAVAAAREKARTLAAWTAKRMLHAYGMTTDDCAWFNRYSVAWYWCGGICPDDDNVLARCKSYKDGCCDAMNVDDKYLRCAGIDLPKAGNRKERKVVFRFWHEEKKYKPISL